MARGGKRTGTPGKNYANRTDMHQPIRVAPGQEYGQTQALENAQRAVPLPQGQAPGGAATPTPPAVAAPPALAGAQDFTRATERPDEPVTAGLASGPGPGPEVLSTMSQPQLDEVGQQLRQLYAASPNNDLLRLIELHDQGF